MVSAISAWVIDADDIELIARFWRDVLDWGEVERDGEVITIGPAGGGAGIDVVRVPEAKTLKNRLHLDLRADGSSRPDELARLVGLGATTVDVGQRADVSWTVLADPEGNEFCLLSRTVQDVLDAAE